MRLRDASKILNYDKEKRAVDQEPKLTKEEIDADSEWKNKVEEPKKSKYLVYLTIGTLIFFMAAIATAYFVQYAGIDRTISTDKVTIAVQGASTVDSGMPIPLIIRTANRNPALMENAVLSITYPTGTFIEQDGFVKPTRRKEIVFGKIETGEIMNNTIEPILYGKRGETKKIRYSLNYTIKGVAQPQKVEGSYDIVLREPPILLSEPKHTTPIAGKEITFTFEVQSNAEAPIPVTYIDVRYPTGFTPSRNGFSLPPASVDGTAWEIVNLQPATKQTITVRGIIRGKEGESQGIVVRTLVSPTGSQTEAVEIASDKDILVIGQAFLDVDLLLNNKEVDQVVVDPDSEIEGIIRWRNQDSAKLSNLTLTATITGTGLDETSVQAGNDGNFNEVHKQLIWDRESVRNMANIRAGEVGEVSFRFKTLPDRLEFAQEQKYVQIAVSATAVRSETGRVESVRDIAVGQVNLRSVLQVVANTLYGSSMIENSGPLPPQVGKTTTYTLKYFIKNSGNEIANFTMAIPLGPRVEPTGEVLGVASSEWEYDKENRAIKIDIPSFSAKGPDSNRSVEIQVSIRPKSEDLGDILTLANNATYIAQDTFVNEAVNGRTERLDTNITAERVGETRVVEYQQEIQEDEIKERIQAPQIQQ